MTQRSDVYGRYSLGSGAILKDPNRVWAAFADPEIVASYRASIARDLVKSGIPATQLAQWDVMDVGTGRQALALLELGARHVDHFDISAENVDRVRRHIADAGLGAKLATRCCDLVQTDLGRDRYDFVYLNGIVQHFSDVGRGIANCVRALRQDGRLWLYFYRSGTFDNFVLYALRKLMYGSNAVPESFSFDDVHAAARLFYSDTATDNYLTSIYMDGVFTRYARLYSVETYLRATAAMGLEVVSSSGIDPIGRDVDHCFARAATVVTLRKTSAASDAAIDRAAELLSPSREVDQLDPSMYDDPQIVESVRLFARVAKAVAARPAFKDLAAMRIFGFLAQVVRKPDFDPLGRHAALQDVLGNVARAIEGPDRQGDAE